MYAISYIILKMSDENYVCYEETDLEKKYLNLENSYKLLQKKYDELVVKYNNSQQPQQLTLSDNIQFNENDVKTSTKDNIYKILKYTAKLTGNVSKKKISSNVLELLNKQNKQNTDKLQPKNNEFNFSDSDFDSNSDSSS